MTDDKLKELLTELEDAVPARQYRPLYEAVLYLLRKDVDKRRLEPALFDDPDPTPPAG
jgi:hypothetical protein